MPSTNKEMVEDLRKQGVLKSPEIIDAFLKIDRKKFLKVEQYAHAYDDSPLPTLSGQTISQPYTVAFMFELLKPLEGQTVLDIGSGSGWTTTMLAELVGVEGKVTGTEIIPALVELGRENVEKFKHKNIKIEQAVRNELGIKGEMFDRILVSASASKMPNELIDQLKPGGVMVIPVGENIVKLEKSSDDKIKTKDYPGFVFVPLV
jgi:protein-L-isoaspartate(D-aspartate) O-methyltransferase